jgi:hypothetical protein
VEEAQSMLQGTILNQPCVKRYSTESKQVVREVLPVNGVQEKHRWLLKHTSQQVVAIEDNGSKKEIFSGSVSATGSIGTVTISVS